MRQMREAIVDVDLAVLTAVNRRVELAARLAAYRRAHGLDAETSGDAETMRAYVTAANAGPLGDADVRRIVALLDEVCGGA